MAAQSVEVMLTKFNESKDQIDLHIELKSGSTVDLVSGTDNAPLVSVGGDDKTWNLLFSAIGELGPNDLVAWFEIRAIPALDDDPSDPASTSEHFLISGATMEYTAIPEPGTLFLMGSGCLLVLGYFARRRMA